MSGVGKKARIATVALLLFISNAFPSHAAAATDQVCDGASDFALGREDYTTAIRLHRRLLQSQPNNALAHYHLGFAYGMVGHRSEEINEYLKSAHLGLRKWDLFLNLGLAYFDQHDLARAAKALEIAVSLGPEHPEAHFNLALVYESENRLGEALREITAAQRLAPQDPDVANTNAIIEVEMGDLIRARDIWRSLIQVAPDYQPARTNLSILNQSIARNSQFEWRAELSYSHAEVGAGDSTRNRDFGNLQTTAAINGDLR
jgi:Flp pilus assembly protein TadD